MTLLALAAWFGSARRRVSTGHLLAIGLAGGAFLCKASYFPVWVILGGALAWRFMRTPSGVAMKITAMALFLVPLGTLSALRWALPVDWAFFQKIIDDQLGPLGPRGVCQAGLGVYGPASAPSSPGRGSRPSPYRHPCIRVPVMPMLGPLPKDCPLSVIARRRYR